MMISRVPLGVLMLLGCTSSPPPASPANVAVGPAQARGGEWARTRPLSGPYADAIAFCRGQPDCRIAVEKSVQDGPEESGWIWRIGDPADAEHNGDHVLALRGHDGVYTLPLFRREIGIGIMDNHVDVFEYEPRDPSKLRVEFTDGMTEGAIDGQGAKDRYPRFVMFCGVGPSKVPSCTGRIALPYIADDGRVHMTGAQPQEILFR